MRKYRLREVKSLAQSHTAKKRCWAQFCLASKLTALESLSVNEGTHVSWVAKVEPHLEKRSGAMKRWSLELYPLGWQPASCLTASGPSKVLGISQPRFPSPCNRCECLPVVSIAQRSGCSWNVNSPFYSTQGFGVGGPSSHTPPRTHPPLLIAGACPKWDQFLGTSVLDLHTAQARLWVTPYQLSG